MAKKLFKNVTMADAEMADIINAGEDTEIVEEGAAEELEVADVGEELQAEQSDIEEYSDGVQEAGEDLEDLEGLETELEAELDDPESEGVNETTLAAHRVTLNILARRNGLDLSYQQSRITKQSLQASGVNDGVSAGRIVLAGVKDAIIAIWEKIKAALKMLWDKVVKFWNKHLSAVGRVQKALISTRKKMKALKGTPDYAKTHKAPSGLIRMFPTASVIDDKVVKEYITVHGEAHNTVSRINSQSRQYAGRVAALVKAGRDAPTPDEKWSFDGDKKFEIGTETKPLVGGFWAVVEFEETDDSEDDNKKFKGKYDKETVEPSKDEMDLTVASKSQMDTLLNTCIEMMKNTVKMGKEIKDGDKQYQKDIKTISDKIGEKKDDGTAQDDADEQKFRRQVSRAGKTYQFMQTVAPSATTKVGSLNVQLARAVISFCKSCASKYKKS